MMILFIKFVDPKTGEEKQIIVSVDDGIRPNANLVDLAKLKPAFKKDGTTTAGNQEGFSFANFWDPNLDRICSLRSLYLVNMSPLSIFNHREC